MISRTIRVLLVGGIGTGKSTLAGFLRQRGALTIDADGVGHDVLRNEAFPAVSERWPKVVRDGSIDRSALAEIVFSDPDELRQLEAMTHPHIAARIRSQVAQASEDLVVVEAPVLEDLLGPGWVKVVVTATESERIARLTAGGMSQDDIRARIASQPDPDVWLSDADVVVDNSGPAGKLPLLVDELIDRIRLVASERDTPPS